MPRSRLLPGAGRDDDLMFLRLHSQTGPGSCAAPLETHNSFV